MVDLDSNIRYVFTMVDNVSSTADTITDSAIDAQNALHQVEVQQDEVVNTTEQVTQGFTRQEAQMVKNLAVLSTVQSSVSAVSSALITMGVVTGESAQKMQTLVAGVQLLTGLAQGVQALAAVSEALKASEMGLAVIETFRSVMQSPWKAALVGLGAGAVAGAATALLSTSGSSTSSSTTVNNITVENTRSTLSTGNSINAVINNGKVM